MTYGRSSLDYPDVDEAAMETDDEPPRVAGLNPSGVLCACGDPSHCPWHGGPWTKACIRTCARFYSVMRDTGAETNRAIAERDVAILEETIAPNPEPKIPERS